MKDLKDTCRVAVVQAAPVMFDKAACTDKAVALIREAAANGAESAAIRDSTRMVVPAKRTKRSLPPLLRRRRDGSLPSCPHICIFRLRRSLRLRGTAWKRPRLGANPHPARRIRRLMPILPVRRPVVHRFGTRSQSVGHHGHPVGDRPNRPCLDGPRTGRRHHHPAQGGTAPPRKTLRHAHVRRTHGLQLRLAASAPPAAPATFVAGRPSSRRTHARRRRFRTEHLRRRKQAASQKIILESHIHLKQKTCHSPPS